MIVEKRTIGICMPISKIGNKDTEHWRQVKDFIIRTCKKITEYDLVVNLVSDDEQKEVIHKRIVSNLYQNDIVICDVSENNPNVMFELGMRLAFNKPTIIIKNQTTKYNFDSGIIKHLTYPDDLNIFSMEIFERDLQKQVLSIFEALTNNTYESFLDSLNLKNVKPSNIEYQEIEFTKFVIESLKSIEQSLNSVKNAQKIDGIARIKKAYRLREPLRLALINIEKKIIDKSIAESDFLDEYYSNYEVRDLMEYYAFFIIAEQYFYDRDIEVLPI